MTLERFVITGCSNGSAVVVEGTKNAKTRGITAHRSTTSPSSDSDREWSGTILELVVFEVRERSVAAVILRDCSFRGNRAENGSAIHAVDGCAVR